jgi:signal transduction histidine kinase
MHRGCSLGEEIALQRMPTSLEEVVRESIDALAPLAEERHVSLACQAAGDTRALLDATWMGQVVENLLANAIRHAPQGSSVRVALSGDEAHVACSVSDQGPGVPPELREAIFDRFRSAGPRPGSAGLGLYVTRGLLGLHGGRVWVEQPEAGGARFCFELPRAAP